jgi:hypothetical protein
MDDVLKVRLQGPAGANFILVPLLRARPLVRARGEGPVAGRSPTGHLAFGARSGPH